MTDLSSHELQVMKALGVSHPTRVEASERATVWKVSLQDGRRAALKAYRGTSAQAEAPGLDLMQALNGHGAALILARRPDAVLLEWLDEPSLGDLTRMGRDDEANLELVRVAVRLHERLGSIRVELRELESWFQELFDLQFAPDCPPQARENLQRCQALAKQLLAGQTDIRPLHGDLHHDNIRLGERGYCAFDARGILGERAFELANALRNPRGARETVSDVRRIVLTVRLWASEFRVPPGRLLKWGAVKSALSIAWRANGRIESDREFDLLATFLKLSDEWPNHAV